MFYRLTLNLSVVGLVLKPIIPAAVTLSAGSGEQLYALGNSEQLLFSEVVDFSRLPAGIGNLIPGLAGLTSQDLGGNGVYFIRIGGTEEVADGTLILTLTTTHAGYVNTPDATLGASFANPGVPRLVKLTAAHSAPSGKARIKGFSILFVGA